MWYPYPLAVFDISVNCELLCCTDENYVENCVTCLTDSPDIHVVSLPHLRPQLKVDAVHLVGRYDSCSLQLS